MRLYYKIYTHLLETKNSTPIFFFIFNLVKHIAIGRAISQW